MHHNNNSLQSPEIVSSLQTPNLTGNLTNQSKCGQTVQTAQSMDSLQTKPKLDQKFDQSNLTDHLKFDQTAQEEHRVVTAAKLGAAHESKSPQVSVRIP